MPSSCALCSLSGILHIDLLPHLSSDHHICLCCVVFSFFGCTRRLKLHRAQIPHNVGCRPIFSGLLHNLGQFPPEAALSILTTLQDRVLGMGDAIPADLQAEPFGDTALSQVMPRSTLEAACINTVKDI